MLAENELESYRRAGKLLAEVREEIRKLVRAGVALLDLAETAEELIRQKGAKPAFPCNVSLNEIAAHYSPPAGDTTTIKEGDVVKVDLGAHIDGYIADTAFTIATGEKKEIVSAVEKALEEAIKVVRPGVNVSEIGKAVEDVATASGFKPIRNLSGHSLARWTLHAGITIPNFNEKTDQKIKAGDILAIEPFLTDGAGSVEDQPQVYIYRYMRDRPVRLRMAKKLLLDIKRVYGGLPFAERWLTKNMSKLRMELSLRELIGVGAIYPYHVLKERAGGVVAQAEHTVIVTDEGCEVTTR